MILTVWILEGLLKARILFGDRMNFLSKLLIHIVNLLSELLYLHKLLMIIKLKLGVLLLKLSNLIWIKWILLFERLHPQEHLLFLLLQYVYLLVKVMFHLLLIISQTCKKLLVASILWCFLWQLYLNSFSLRLQFSTFLLNFE